jgi:hypothetical protein
LTSDGSTAERIRAEAVQTGGGQGTRIVVHRRTAGSVGGRIGETRPCTVPAVMSRSARSNTGAGA